MTHDWMMWCARQFGGSRDAALVCPHRGPSCGSRVPRPNARAVCHAARCCAALCGIAKPAPRCFQDPSWIPVQKQEGKHNFTQSMTFGSSKNMAPKLDNAFLQGFMQVYRMVETGCRVVSCSASGYKYLQQTMSLM